MFSLYSLVIAQIIGTDRKNLNRLLDQYLKSTDSDLIKKRAYRLILKLHQNIHYYHGCDAKCITSPKYCVLKRSIESRWIVNLKNELICTRWKLTGISGHNYYDICSFMVLYHNIYIQGFYIPWTDRYRLIDYIDQNFDIEHFTDEIPNLEISAHPDIDLLDKISLTKLEECLLCCAWKNDLVSRYLLAKLTTITRVTEYKEIYSLFSLRIISGQYYLANHLQFIKVYSDRIQYQDKLYKFDCTESKTLAIAIEKLMYENREISSPTQSKELEESSDS